MTDYAKNLTDLIAGFILTIAELKAIVNGQEVYKYFMERDFDFINIESEVIFDLLRTYRKQESWQKAKLVEKILYQIAAECPTVEDRVYIESYIPKR